MAERTPEGEDLLKAIEKLTVYTDRLERRLDDVTDRLDRVTSALADAGNRVAVGDYRIINPYLDPNNPWSDFLAVRELSIGQSAVFSFLLTDDFQAESRPERPYLVFEARNSQGQANQILEVTCNDTQIFGSPLPGAYEWRTYTVALEDPSILQPGSNQITFTHGGGAENPVYGIEISTTILHYQRMVIDSGRIADAL